LAVRPVILYPDERLKTPCAPVGLPGDARQVAEDLIATMDAGPPRTVGIAAPQIGEMVRVAVVDTSRNPKYPPGHGLLILINPEIVAHDGKQLFREGCLSIPEFTANITRHMNVDIRATNLEGQVIEVSATGFEAVVIQHEIDHLDGILFLDRVTNINTDLFRRKS
jgi:peptide deformylase